MFDAHWRFVWVFTKQVPDKEITTKAKLLIVFLFDNYICVTFYLKLSTHWKKI